MDYIRIHNDKWEDAGIIYSVLAYRTHPPSTAVDLELEHNGYIIKKVVASHQIEWIDSKEP